MFNPQKFILERTFQPEAFQDNKSIQILLDQLDIEYKALVLDLDEKVGKIYTCSRNQFEFLMMLENTYTLDDPRGPRYEGNQSSGMVVGTNENEYEQNNLNDDPILHFLREDIVPKLRSMALDHDFFFLFHSTSSSGVLKHHGTLFNDLPLKATLREINLQKGRLEEESAALLHTKIVERKYQDLDMAKEQYQKFTDGWKHIIEASTKGEIATLFVRPNNLIQPGYVLNNELVFLEPQENTVPVSNIFPWLLKSVVAQNGLISVLKEPEFQSEVEIQAQLRF